MKHALIAALVAASFGLAAAPAAQAGHVPSDSYCHYSLAGGGSLAPDNDLGRVVNRLANNGYNVTSISEYTSTATPTSHYRWKEYLFWAGWQRTVFRYAFHCYNDPWNKYHDGEVGILGTSTY